MFPTKMSRIQISPPIVTIEFIKKKKNDDMLIIS